MLHIIFPFLSPIFLEAVTSSAVLEHTSKATSATLLQNKDLTCIKTVNTWRDTHTLVSMVFPTNALQQPTQLTGVTAQNCLCNGDVTLSQWLLGGKSSHHFLVHFQQQALRILFVHSYRFLSLTPTQSSTSQANWASEIFLKSTHLRPSPRPSP